MSVAEDTVRVVRLKNGGTREFRSKEERRRIVEATLKPGASVIITRKRLFIKETKDVESKQVINWFNGC